MRVDVRVRDGRRELHSRPGAISPAPDGGDGVVVDARHLAPDVLAFGVEIDRPIAFHAGQFVGLQFPEGELDELAAASRGALEVTIASSEKDPPEHAAAAHGHLAFRRGLVHEVARSAVHARYEGIAYLS